MISSLRQNSLEVLVSPRVRTIPKSYRVTVFTYLFIILGTLCCSCILELFFRRIAEISRFNMLPSFCRSSIDIYVLVQFDNLPR